MKVKRIIVSISIAILFIGAIVFSMQNDQHVDNQASEVVVKNIEAKADRSIDPWTCHSPGWCRINGEEAFMMPIYFPDHMVME